MTMAKTNLMHLHLGDWSEDGHGHHEQVLVKVNKSVEEVRKAYHDSCDKTGVSFHNEYPKRRESQLYFGCNYADVELTPEIREVFTRFGCPYLEWFDDDDLFDDVQDEHGRAWFAMIWLWFTSLSLSDMEWEIIPPDGTIPSINGGYSDDSLHESFGYGLWDL